MERVFKARPSALGKIMSNAKVKGELSSTCITYLMEWYADDQEEIDSKYFRKGILKEDDCIDFAVDVLNLGIGIKNINIFANEWVVGTPDVLFEKCVLDTKCSWSYKTLCDSAIKLNKDYEWQLHGYMWLCDKQEAILFYGLLDTPSEANYGVEVVWEHLPIESRWVAYKFKRSEEKIDEIKAKVEQCREWLKEYDKSMKQELGKLHQIE